MENLGGTAQTLLLLEIRATANLFLLPLMLIIKQANIELVFSLYVYIFILQKCKNSISREHANEPFRKAKFDSKKQGIIFL